MRITFECHTAETLEYLRIVNTILRSNQSVEENVKAYAALKAAVESIDKRLKSVEDRRNRVCR